MTEGEKVLVFPTQLLHSMFGGLVPQGFITPQEGTNAMKSIFHSTALSYEDRAEMETNPNFKQLIPYCVFRRGNRYFVYKRTKKGAENRLHEKWSLGIGGHINPVDADPKGEYPDYMLGFFREIYEETGLLFKDGRIAMNSVVGFVNDDFNEVGKVHFGVVHLINLDSCGGQEIKSKDPAIADGQWLTRTEIEANYDRFENWSQLIIKKFTDHGYRP